MRRKIKKNGPDTRSVDVNDSYAMEYWAREFGETQVRIKAAVQIAGTEAFKVKRELKKPKTLQNDNTLSGEQSKTNSVGTCYVQGLQETS